MLPLISQPMPLGSFTLPNFPLEVVDQRMVRNIQYLLEDTISEIQANPTRNAPRTYAYNVLSQNFYQNQDFKDLVQFIIILMEHEMYTTNKPIEQVSREIIPAFTAAFSAGLWMRDNPMPLDPNTMENLNVSYTSFQHFMQTIQMALGQRSRQQQVQQQQYPNQYPQQPQWNNSSPYQQPNQNPYGGYGQPGSPVMQQPQVQTQYQPQPTNPYMNPNQQFAFSQGNPSAYPGSNYQGNPHMQQGRPGFGQAGYDPTFNTRFHSAPTTPTVDMTKTALTPDRFKPVQPVQQQAQSTQASPLTMGRFAQTQSQPNIPQVNDAYLNRAVPTPTQPEPQVHEEEESEELTKEDVLRGMIEVWGHIEKYIQRKQPVPIELAKGMFTCDMAYFQVAGRLQETPDFELVPNDYGNRYHEFRVNFNKEQELLRAYVKQEQEKEKRKKEEEAERARRMKYIGQNFNQEEKENLAEKSPFHKAAFELNEERQGQPLVTLHNIHDPIHVEPNAKESLARLDKAVEQHRIQKPENVLEHPDVHIQSLTDDEMREIFGDDFFEVEDTRKESKPTESVDPEVQEEVEEEVVEEVKEVEPKVQTADEAFEELEAASIDPMDIPDQYGVTERERQYNEYRDRNFKRKWKPSKYQKFWETWDPWYFVCKLEEPEPGCGCLVQKFYPRNAPMELRDHLLPGHSTSDPRELNSMTVDRYNQNDYYFEKMWKETASEEEFEESKEEKEALNLNLEKAGVEVEDVEVDTSTFKQPVKHDYVKFADDLQELASSINRTLVNRDDTADEVPVTFEGVITNPVVTKGNYNNVIDELAACEQPVEVHQVMSEAKAVLPYSIWLRVDELYTREINEFLAFGVTSGLSIDSFYEDFVELSEIIDEKGYMDPFAAYFKTRIKNILLSSENDIYHAGLRSMLDLDEDTFEEMGDVANILTNETWLAEKVSFTVLPLDSLATDMKVNDAMAITSKTNPKLFHMLKWFSHEKQSGSVHDQYIQTNDGRIYRMIRNAFNREFFYAKRVL